MSRIAYLASRFPKITETFVLYEMQAIERDGGTVEVFALQREPPGPRHPEAVPYERRAHFAPFLSLELLAANLSLLTRAPRRYLGVWWAALSGTWRSPKFFLGAVIWFPKCVAFAERMVALGVEHVHAHFAHHPALAAFIVHRLTGIPFSFTAHGSDLHVDRTMLPEKVRAASFVVTVSSYNRDLILEECGPEVADKVTVIHCGTDPAVFGPGSAAAVPAETNGGPARTNGTHPADAAERPLRIVCVASLEEVKGHRYLIEACRLLAERGVPFRCDLAGDGSLRGKLTRIVTRAGLEERIVMHGALPRGEVQRLLAEADVAVLPSVPTRSGRREGIPVALMEAMMSGLPVVASGVSGIPELVRDGETGHLVPPGDPWSLADRLQELAESPSRRAAFGANGRAVVERDFDLTMGARQLHAAITRP